jgi:hypothetical protein
MEKNMEKNEITLDEYLNALEVIERYKYQEDKTIQVSVTYDAKIYVNVKVPNTWSIEKIKKELEDGSYHGLELEDSVQTDIQNMSILIADGEIINLNSDADNNVDIDIKVFVCDENNSEVVKFTYNGSGDVVRDLDAAIKKYTVGKEYNEFVDMNMDNPWTRIITIKNKIK